MVYLFIAFGHGFPSNTINKRASARDSPFMFPLRSQHVIEINAELQINSHATRVW